MNKFIVSVLAAASATQASPVVDVGVGFGVGLPDNHPASKCCSLLENAGLENVFYPNSSDYMTRNQGYFSISARLKPGCIVQPKTTKEVSIAVKTIVEDSDCDFAVRSGGHTAFPGGANIDDGVTIDLGAMRKVEYDADEDVAKIQPGPTWAEVYGKLESDGVTVGGGRTGTVGIGGFLTGGGNNFFAAQYGLGCDQVVNFEVVLSDGKIIEANKDANSDLFKALKGGGSNFGIVTRFDMKAIKVGKLWGGLVTYNISESEKFIDAYVDWTNNIENYPEGSVIPFWSYDPTVGEEVIILAYEDTTGTEKPEAFDAFMDIDNVISSTMRLDTHKNLADELELAAGYRNVVLTFTFKNEKETFQYIVDQHKQFIKEFDEQSPDGDFYLHGIFQSIPTLFAEHAEKAGGNVLGLDKEEDNAMLFQIQALMKGEDQEKVMRELAVEFFDDIKEFSVKQGAEVDWIYLNYADYTQDPLPMYGEENIAHLKKVAESYDPEGIYQKRMPGGFKISEV